MQRGTLDSALSATSVSDSVCNAAHTCSSPFSVSSAWSKSIQYECIRLEEEAHQRKREREELNEIRAGVSERGRR